jgi:hypothetical protein
LYAPASARTIARMSDHHNARKAANAFELDMLHVLNDDGANER